MKNELSNNPERVIEYLKKELTTISNQIAYMGEKAETMFEEELTIFYARLFDNDTELEWCRERISEYSQAMHEIEIIAGKLFELLEAKRLDRNKISTLISDIHGITQYAKRI